MAATEPLNIFVVAPSNVAPSMRLSILEYLVVLFHFNLGMVTFTSLDLLRI
jgi:hypothetical protein